MDFRQALKERRFVYTCEVDPPKVPRLAVTLEKLAPIAPRLAALSVADNPLAHLRMDALACSALLLQRLGRPIVMHLTCRDYSLLGLHSRLLGAHALGVRSILCMTGDPPKLGPFKEAKGMFAFNSVGLVRLVAEMNRGRTSNLDEMPGSTDFLIGCVANPNAANLRAEVDRLKRKLEAGASFVKTQPVFDMDTLDRFLSAAQGLEVPIMLGIMPLTSHAFARHIAETVPEVFVPAQILKALETVDDLRTGIDIARAFMDGSRERVQGFHFFPMSKYGMLNELIEGGAE